MIRTQRIYLRELLPNDSDDYFLISPTTDAILMKYASFFATNSPKKAKEFLTEHYFSNYSRLLGIFSSKNDSLIGALLVKQYYFNKNYLSYLDLSFFISETYRGNGYITETLKSIIDYYSGKGLFLEYLKFVVDPKNDSCIKVMEKIQCECWSDPNLSFGYPLKYRKKL